MNKFKIKSTIYHGTISDIDNIDLTAGRGYKDFGKGFYLAYNKAQSIGIINKNYKKLYMHLIHLKITSKNVE